MNEFEKEEDRQTRAPMTRSEFAQLGDGAFPLTPLYWYTYPNLEDLSIKSSFAVNLLNQIDLTKVVVREQ